MEAIYIKTLNYLNPNYAYNEFIKCCENGNLDKIKIIVNNCIIDIHAKNELGFLYACTNGHLNIVIYLINLYKNDNKYTIVNIHANNESGFRLACLNGHLHVVEYLINLYKINSDYDIINIHAENESGFQRACYSGYLHIIKYLINLYKTNKNYQIINIHARMYYAFKTTHSNYFKRANMYLFSLGSYITYYTHNRFEHHILL